MAATNAPLLSFGVLTDIQYADCDSKPAWWNPSLTRYYRTALSQIDRAFAQWNKDNVSFVLQLGDIIDGINHRHSNSERALTAVLERFELHQNIPTFHTVGNHELYNFNRRDLAQHFNDCVSKMSVRHPKLSFPDTPTDSALYYSFRPVDGVKCVSLDCFEISVIGYEKTHPNYVEAARLLYEHHGHDDFEGWDCADLLVESQKRFQQMNGAVSARQLLWLESELRDSDERKEKVIVFGHVCLHPESADWDCLLWNYEKVLEIFHRHDSVAAYLCGHTHQNGYARDRKGIHYVVFAGIIETSPVEEAFATVAVYKNRLEVLGFGRESSRTLSLERCVLEEGDDCSEADPVTSLHSVKVVV